ncbi:hypothetical protein EC973_006185 [Apophysomyces ossiformis]|uniref:F-box domain-containing protein n=1 Tax=Apophysomyces ossiformis TaxID=679940 RepID=A0A8H7EUM2_9FUNG|nr:hypothetical protein EC973_006185 [Apophysomyces ossiformis]
MASIPAEIILTIASFLEPKDIANCIRVCRSWNVKIIPALYNTVEIAGNRKFHLFTETLRKTRDTSHLGHLVRKLNLRFRVKYHELTELIPLCPFVTEFHTSNWLNHEWGTILQEWRYLEKVPKVVVRTKTLGFSLGSFRTQIKELSICSYIYCDWLNLLQELPCVEELTITCANSDMPEASGKISISELETLHDALRHLRVLKLERFQLYGEMSRTIEPCSSVRALTLRVANGDLWGDYFGQKYTQLRQLFLGIFVEYSETMRSQAQTLARSCRCLQVFNDQASFYHNTRLYQDILDVLGEIRSPLTDLRLEQCDASSYARFVSSFYGTVLDLYYSSAEEVTVKEITEPLKLCLSLERIEIYHRFHGLQVNLFLDGCKTLQELRIYGGLIYLSEEPNVRDQHRLKILTLDGSKITNDVFPYLVQRCPYLSQLSCRYDEYTGSSSMIHFPNRNLKKLFVQCRDNAVFRVTELDPSVQWTDLNQLSADTHKPLGTVRWYYAFVNEDELPFKRSVITDINEILGAPTVPNADYFLDEHPIVSILCYRLDSLWCERI